MTIKMFREIYTLLVIAIMLSFTIFHTAILLNIMLTGGEMHIRMCEPNKIILTTEVLLGTFAAIAGTIMIIDKVENLRKIKK